MEQHELERAFAEIARHGAAVELEMMELPLVTRLGPGRSRGIEMHTGREPGQAPWASVVLAALDGGELPMRDVSIFDYPTSGVEGFVGDPGYILSGGYGIEACGYVNQSLAEDGQLLSRTALYRRGICEWGFRYRWPSETNAERIPSSTFVENVNDALRYFGSVFTRGGYYGRVQVWVRIDNADLSSLRVHESLIRQPRAPGVEDLEWTTVTNVELLTADPMPIVHEAMDFVWQGYGYERCALFSADGEYLKR
jgi:hypothetical protein